MGNVVCLEWWGLGVCMGWGLETWGQRHFADSSVCHSCGCLLLTECSNKKSAMRAVAVFMMSVFRWWERSMDIRTRLKRLSSSQLLDLTAVFSLLGVILDFLLCMQKIFTHFPPEWHKGTLVALQFTRENSWGCSSTLTSRALRPVLALLEGRRMVGQTVARPVTLLICAASPGGISLLFCLQLSLLSCLRAADPASS